MALLGTGLNFLTTTRSGVIAPELRIINDYPDIDNYVLIPVHNITLVSGAVPHGYIIKRPLGLHRIWGAFLELNSQWNNASNTIGSPTIFGVQFLVTVHGEY
jgi:hypothetical protein